MENRTIIEKVLLENMDLENKNENVYLWLFWNKEFPWDSWDLGIVKKRYEESDKSKTLVEMQLELLIEHIIHSWEYDEKECNKKHFEEEMLDIAKNLWFEKEFFEMLTWQFDYKNWRGLF